MPESIDIRFKDEENNYIIQDKKTEALKMIRLSCKIYLDTFKDGYHKDHYIDKVLGAFYELIKQGDIEDGFDAKDMSQVKNFLRGIDAVISAGPYFAPHFGLGARAMAGARARAGAVHAHQG